MTRGTGFTALPALIWKTSFPGSEPKNYFFFFPVYIKPHARNPRLYLLWAGELLPEVCGAPRAPDSLGIRRRHCGYCRNCAGDRWELCRCPYPSALFHHGARCGAGTEPFGCCGRMLGALGPLPLWLVCAKLAQDGTRASLSLALLLWVRPPVFIPTDLSQLCWRLAGTMLEAPLSGILAAHVLAAQWLCTFW